MSYANIPPGEGEPFNDTTNVMVDGANRTFLSMEERAYYFVFIEDTKRNLVKALRNYFGNNFRTQAYRWIGTPLPDGTYETNIVDTKVHIAVDYPDNPQTYPRVSVQSVQANINDLWLGQVMGNLVIVNPLYDPSFVEDEVVVDARDGQQPTLEVGKRMGGKMEMGVTLSVKSYSALERDRITDLVLHGLTLPIRQDLYKLSMNWVPNTGAVSGDGLEEITNLGKLYNRTVTFRLQVEWYSDFYYNTPNVDDFTLDDVKVIDLVL